MEWRAKKEEVGDGAEGQMVEGRGYRSSFPPGVLFMPMHTNPFFFHDVVEGGVKNDSGRTFHDMELLQ